MNAVAGKGCYVYAYLYYLVLGNGNRHGNEAIGCIGIGYFYQIGISL